MRIPYPVRLVVPILGETKGVHVRCIAPNPRVVYRD